MIFYTNEHQKEVAEKVIAELTREKVYADPIVTAIEPASTFYVAEDYHQNYLENNPMQPYCMFVVAPKAQKIRQKYADRLKAKAIIRARTELPRHSSGADLSLSCHLRKDTVNREFPCSKAPSEPCCCTMCAKRFAWKSCAPCWVGAALSLPSSTPRRSMFASKSLR